MQLSVLDRIGVRSKSRLEFGAYGIRGTGKISQYIRFLVVVQRSAPVSRYAHVRFLASGIRQSSYALRNGIAAIYGRDTKHNTDGFPHNRRNDPRINVSVQVIPNGRRGGPLVRVLSGSCGSPPFDSVSFQYLSTDTDSFIKFGSFCHVQQPRAG